ncbi:MAG: polysaccharide pyruvyl transferase family protein [Ruminococcaceae bacterium]|nr:polysaccharide pyruvyl transferase family protein [Oscillospiraceae bacterium]
MEGFASGNRILIWRSVALDGGLNIFDSTDYKNFYSDISNHFDGNCPNWGNKLWFQGLISEIDDGSNQITFRSNESLDEINDKFDLIIYPMANFFGVEYCRNIESIVSTFSKIKIPVYIIACGVQAKDYNHLEWLIKEIGEEAKKFITAIYNTGGEIALRGYFSKEFFERLGFPSAQVTGCPSLYQFGRNFRVSTKKVSERDFCPVFNGKIQYYTRAIDYYKHSIHIDQDQYFKPLFDPSFFNNDSINSMYYYYTLYGKISAKLLSEKRIKLIADMNDWFYFLKNGSFDFAFGSRIHGTIMAVLAGIPATLLAIDTRTREMAEFFDIPYINVSEKDDFGAEKIYDSYLDSDYSKFNDTFESKYLAYQSFLQQHKIVSSINEKNKFFKEETAKKDFEKYINDPEKFLDYYKKLKYYTPLFEMRKMVGNLSKKFR